MEALDRIELAARRALDNRKRAADALAWYDDAHRWILSLADRFSIPLERVAGFVAALSPQNGWHDQLRWTADQMAAALDALQSGPIAPIEILAEHVPGPGFRANKVKALRILQGEEPLSVLSGPKVRAFFANLCGDKRAVTVDRHAFSVAFGVDFEGTLTARRYKLAARAYAAAAAVLGIEPAECQSLVWVYFKETRDGAAW